jgi:hypothetical protein
MGESPTLRLRKSHGHRRNTVNLGTGQACRASPLLRVRGVCATVRDTGRWESSPAPQLPGPRHLAAEQTPQDAPRSPCYAARPPDPLLHLQLRSSCWNIPFPPVPHSSPRRAEPKFQSGRVTRASSRSAARTPTAGGPIQRLG